jgi:hypothetical protein
MGESVFFMFESSPMKLLDDVLDLARTLVDLEGVILPLH